IYVNFTWNEMGDIPFFCPPNYEYASLEVKQACEVRAANLICQWTFLFLAIVWAKCSYDDSISEHLDLGKQLTDSEESYDY
ncbi:13018_t:CDS:1, partial [Cetraspora pellucida]